MSKLALTRLKEKFGAAILETYSTPRGDDIALVEPAQIRAVCAFLKSDAELDFSMCTSVTCVDRMLLPETSPRFELVYLLFSLEKNHRLVLKARIDEAAPGVNPIIDSVQPVWRCADWWERMIWDMYGVKFAGHPNLKRLYMYEEFVGHPLRKDYPLKGRQPLIPERNFKDLVRGPGANPRD
jgi:NADH-quinone oxidoreductase subunit C